MANPIESKAPRNRHPVDELGDVRRRIRELQEREAELRRTILAGECDLTGDECEAEIVDKVHERLDEAALKLEFGMTRLRPFLQTKPFQMVRVTDRGGDESVRKTSGRLT